MISTPPGIDCGATCSASFEARSPVTLMAVADVASTFGSWSGACGGTGTCVVAAGADATVEATFQTRPPEISVAISPSAASIATGAKQQFSATVSGSADTTVLWSVREGAAGGFVDGSGLYAAPAAAGVYHVIAASRADPAKSAAATVTVTRTSPTVPPRLEMAGFDSTLHVGELSLDAEGRGSSRVGKISIRSSQGSIEIDGRALPGIVFQRQPFSPPSQIVAYEIAAVAPDRMYLMWIYCPRNDPKITQVWVESTAGEGLTPESASGSCTDNFAASDPRLRAPAVSMPWPDADRGFSVSGTDVDLPARGAGTVSYGAATQVVFHFVTVDCSFCANPGWYELHSLLWNPQTDAVTLGIFYLRIGGGPVTLAYTLSMPVLARGPDIHYTATWSRPSSSSAASLVMATSGPVARPAPPDAPSPP